MTRDQRKATAMEFFRRLDEGGDVFELFAEDAVFHFPKWGIARGEGDIRRLFDDVGRLYSRIRHHYDEFNFAVDGDIVVAEGTSEGTTVDGKEWHGGITPAGRWCDVFEIRDFEIHRCFVYLDPDYAGADADRYPWLRTVVAVEA